MMSDKGLSNTDHGLSDHGTINKEHMLPLVEAKQRLTRWIIEQTGCVVQGGPFAGMTMLDEETNWKDDNIGTKLLGVYEQELHEQIEIEIARLEKLDAPKIVNIGCAEGYYAIGMARRLPKAIVTGIDIDEEALRVTETAAELNDVSIRFAVDAETGDAAMAAPDLVICDCEGAEIEYLNPEQFPALLKATIILECHADTAYTVAPRFEATHKIWLVEEGWRDPNKIDILRSLHSHERWMCISEGRPVTMHWLYMTPTENAAA